MADYLSPQDAFNTLSDEEQNLYIEWIYILIDFGYLPELEPEEVLEKCYTMYECDHK